MGCPAPSLNGSDATEQRPKPNFRTGGTERLRRQRMSRRQGKIEMVNEERRPLEL